MYSIIPSFIGLINEENKPILIYIPPKETAKVDNVLKYNTLANISLDYFDSQLFEWSALNSDRSVKSLFQVEGISVYGMIIKPVGLKIVIGFDSDTACDNEETIIDIFEGVKKIYIRVKCNPFIDLGDRQIGELLKLCMKNSSNSLQNRANDAVFKRSREKILRAEKMGNI